MKCQNKKLELPREEIQIGELPKIITSLKKSLHAKTALVLRDNMMCYLKTKSSSTVSFVRQDVIPFEREKFRIHS